jgi:hypothetical protein
MTFPNLSTQPSSSRRVVVRLLGLVLASGAITASCSSAAEDLGGDRLPTDAASLQTAAAAAMADVSTVRFDLVPTGGPIYIDSVESLSLIQASGRYSAPGSADAVLTVEVNGSLTTKLGAVAIDSDVWLSNPVTGTFELLPVGFDIDPTTFFDPQDGWQPLLRELKNAEFIAEEERDGPRYHLRGIAPAARVELVTAGLVTSQDVELDLWLHPVTALVTGAEFSTIHNGIETHWMLDLTEYDEAVSISPPQISP